MFKTLPCLANDDFWRVSSDTKTCGSPLYLARILTHFQTKINKKNEYKEFTTENAEGAEKNLATN